MGNYYVLTGQGRTKSWAYLSFDRGEEKLITLAPFNINSAAYYIKRINASSLFGRRDKKYYSSRDYWICSQENRTLLFKNLSELKWFCRMYDYKLVKPKLLKPYPNIILQLVKAGALFQIAEVVFTKPIPQNIIDNLKKNKINWSLQQNGGAFNTLKVFV